MFCIAIFGNTLERRRHGRLVLNSVLLSSSIQNSRNYYDCFSLQEITVYFFCLKYLLKYFFITVMPIYFFNKLSIKLLTLLLFQFAEPVFSITTLPFLSIKKLYGIALVFKKFLGGLLIE